MTRSSAILAAFAVLGALAVASVPLASGAATAADCQATYSGSETDPARVAACHAAQDDASSDVSLEMLQLNTQKAAQGAEAPSAESQAVNAQDVTDEHEEDVALDEEEAAEEDPKPKLTKEEKEAERAAKKEAKNNQQVARQQRLQEIHAQHALKSDTNQLLHLVKIVDKLVQDLTATGQEVPAWVAGYTSWVADQKAAQTLRRQNKVAAQKAKKVEKKVVPLKGKGGKTPVTKTPQTTTTAAGR